MKAQRILVPSDLSSYSEQAARAALAHLRSKGRLTLLHVSEPRYTVVGGLDSAVPVYDEKLTRDHEERGRKALERLAKKLGPRARALVLRGTQPAPLLAAFARRHRADLVVLSTHGRGGLGRLLFGSVAQKLLTLYKGPVIMLRPGKGSR